MEGSYKRYDIVLVDFGETIESEQSGIRPAIIIQNDVGNFYSKSTIVMPMTSRLKNRHQPTHALIRRSKETGLVKDSMLLGECIRQISEKRILQYIGTVTDKFEQSEVKRVYQANFGI